MKHCETLMSMRSTLLARCGPRFSVPDRSRVQLGDARRAIWVLQLAAGLVLLIACANLAGLGLARAESRRREFAMRAALGASRGHLIRQTIIEGALLSVAGGAIGVWLARIGLQALVLTYPTSLPRTGELTIDLPVLLFALVVSVATGVLFGVAPALHNQITDLVHVLKEGHRDGGAAGRHRVRRAIATAEVALAVMLAPGCWCAPSPISHGSTPASIDRGWSPFR